MFNCESVKAPEAKFLKCLAKGKEIDLTIGEEMGSYLMKAMREKDTAKALRFCNLNAIPLTGGVAEK